MSAASAAKTFVKKADATRWARQEETHHDTTGQVKTSAATFTDTITA
jgi:hypothetical protein